MVAEIVGFIIVILFMIGIGYGLEKIFEDD